MGKEDMAMPAARALVLRTEPASSLGHSASVAIALLLLAACGAGPDDSPDAVAMRGVLRMELNQYCLAHMPAGPRQTSYNDWDEAIEACYQTAFYQSNSCPKPRLCLDVLHAQAIEARRAETGTGSVHESAVAESHAPGKGQP